MQRTRKKERYEKKRNTRGVIWSPRFFYSICYELEKKQKDYLIVRLNLIQWKCVSRHGRFVNFFRQRSRPRTFGWNYFRVLESSRLDLQLVFTKFHRLLFAAFWPIRLIIMQQIKQWIKLDWIISLSIRIAMELTELSSRTPHHLPSTRSSWRSSSMRHLTTVKSVWIWMIFD